MKKWIAIVLVALMALSLIACGSKGGSGAADSIVGTWKLVDGEGEAKEAVQMIIAMGGTMEFTFREDGTCTMVMDMLGENQNQDGNYTFSNGKLTIDGSSTNCTLDGNKLTIEVEGMSMVFERK